MEDLGIPLIGFLDCDVRVSGEKADRYHDSRTSLLRPSIDGACSRDHVSAQQFGQAP